MYKRQELGQKAKKYMDQGLLVPDELTCDLVMDRIGQEAVSYTHLDVYKRQVVSRADLEGGVSNEN